MSGRRPSNKDRFLLSLSGSQEYLDRYEYPRRFSQRGLVQRLEMAQSHISRTVKGLVDDGLIISQRRRVANERKRVTAYLLTDKGIDLTKVLNRELRQREVLFRSEDGELARATIADLFPDIEALEVANLLKRAEVHDGMLIVDSPANVDEGDLDLSSETITLLVELAELRMSQGQTNEAAKGLRRAAILHRRQGNSIGEVKCLLNAAGLDGALEDVKHTWKMMKDSGLEIYSGDELLTIWSHLDDEEMIEHCPPHIRSYILCSLGRKNIDDVPISIDGNAKQNAIWRGKRLSLELDRSRGGISDIDEEEVMEVISDLSHGQTSRPELVADIALKHSSERALKAAWELDLSSESAGHVGFSLFLKNGETSILKILMERFKAEGDSTGIEVCKRLLSRV